LRPGRGVHCPHVGGEVACSTAESFGALSQTALVVA